MALEEMTCAPEIIDCVFRLGRALRGTDEYKKLKEAEKNMQLDADAMSMMEAYNAHKKALEDLLSSPAPDSKAIHEHSNAMDRLNHQLQKDYNVITLHQAREAFQTLIQRMNTLLARIVTDDDFAELNNDDDDTDGSDDPDSSLGVLS